MPLERVLLLHNRYRASGGEERSVELTAELLAARGHPVELLERHSDRAGRARAAAGMLSGGLSPDTVARTVRRFGADVVHAHNVHPLFGSRGLAAARAAGARVVLTLHNFRFSCAIGVGYRDGAPCFRCRGRSTLPGLALGCRGSVPEGVAYAAGLAAHQRALVDAVDRFVIVSTATATRLAGLGVPAERTSVLANFVPDRLLAARSCAGEGRYALAAGRLVEEKGWDTAIAAARAARVPLVVAGCGPDETRLRGLASDDDVRFLGQVSPQELARVRAHAGAVLAPSRWEEPCPFAVLEALAAGVPVLVSSLGGLPELVGTGAGAGGGPPAGAVLSPRNDAAWAAALRDLWADPARRQTAGTAALARARERYCADRHYDGLLAAYRG